MTRDPAERQSSADRTSKAPKGGQDFHGTGQTRRLPDAAVPSLSPSRSTGALVENVERARHQLVACRMLEARRACAGILPKGIFIDACWDMLLELFIAAADDQRLWVKELMCLSGETATGTMRRIDRLEEAGLVTRNADPRDHRRVFIGLTVKGSESITMMLRHFDAAITRPPATGG